MQVWNVLHAARWKCRTQKSPKWPSGHHRTTLSGCVFATKACIDNRKKHVKQQYLPHMSSQYGERQSTNGWDPFGSLGHLSKFQRVSRLGSVISQHSGSGRQPNFAAMNRGSHLYSAGRPSRWALAHILVMFIFLCYWDSRHIQTFSQILISGLNWAAFRQVLYSTDPHSAGCHYVWSQTCPTKVVTLNCH